MGSAAPGLAKRAKYQDESTKVSRVSVSRVAGPPHAGQVVCFQVGWRSSALPGLPNSRSSGSATGRAAFGSGTTPSLAQWTTGMGQPQARWRATPQSRRR